MTHPRNSHTPRHQILDAKERIQRIAHATSLEARHPHTPRHSAAHRQGCAA